MLICSLGIYVFSNAYLKSLLGEGIQFGEFLVKCPDIKWSWSLSLQCPDLDIAQKDISINIKQARLNLIPQKKLSLKNRHIKIEATQLNIYLPKKLENDSFKTSITNEATSAAGENEKKSETSWIPEKNIPQLKFPFKLTVKLDSLYVSLEQKNSIQIKNLEYSSDIHGSHSLNFNAMNYNDINVMQSGYTELKPKKDGLDIKLSGKRKNDVFSVMVRLPEYNFKNPDVNVEAQINNGMDYRELLPGLKFWDFQNTNLKLSGSLGSVPFVSLGMEANVSFKKIIPAINIHPKVFKSKFDLYISEKDSYLDVQTKGKDDAELVLKAFSKKLGGLLKGPQYLDSLNNTDASFEGYFKDFGFVAGKNNIPIGINSLKGNIEEKRINIEMTTMDSSVLEAIIDYGKGFQINLEGQISPEETWVKTWTDSNFNYDDLQISLNGTGNEYNLQANLTQGRAYGSIADSLKLFGKIYPFGIQIDSSHWQQAENQWNVYGNILWGSSENMFKVSGKNQAGLYLWAKGADGDFNINMPGYKAIEFQTQFLRPHKLPYGGMEKIPFASPELTGLFKWNFAANSGEADLSAKININNKDISLNVFGDWTADYLELKDIKLEHNKEQLQFKSLIHLKKAPFFSPENFSIRNVEYFSINSSGLELSPWIAMIKDSLVDSLNFKGEMLYNQRGGFSGDLMLDNIRLQNASSELEFNSLVLSGNDFGITLVGGIHSQENEWLNHGFKLKVKNVLEETRDVQITLESLGKINSSINGKLYDSKIVKAVFDIEGDLDLGEQKGKINNLDVMGDIVFDFRDFKKPVFSVSNSKLKQLEYELENFPKLYAQGEFSLDSNQAFLKNLELKSENGQKAKAEGRLLFEDDLKAQFRLESQKFDFPFPGSHLLRTEGLSFKLEQNHPDLILKLDFKNGSYQHRESHMQVGTGLKSVSLQFNKHTGQKELLSSYKLAGELAVENFGLSHQTVSISSLSNMFKRLDRRKANKRKTQKKYLPVEMDLRVYTLGNNNLVNTTFLNSSFEGDVQLTGQIPDVLLTGEVNSIEGEFYLANKSYNLNILGLSWFVEPVEYGSTELSAQIKLAEDCYAKNSDSCYVELITTGKLNDLEFVYSGSCGGDLGDEGEALTLLKSVSLGCYDPDLTGEDASWAFASGLLTDITSSWLKKNTGGLVEGCQIYGIQHLIQNKEDKAQTTSPSYSGMTSENSATTSGVCQTGEIVKGVRGSLGLSSQENSTEYEVGLEWKPPLEKLSENSTWVHRVKNNILLDVKAKSVSDSKNRVEVETETELRLEAGAQYRYNFWEIW